MVKRRASDGFVRFVRWMPPEFIIAVPAGFAFLAVASTIRPFKLNPFVWYLTRATGITLYLLIWATVVLGLGVTTRYFDGWLSKGATYSLHTYLPRLAYAFLAAHLLGLVVDEFMPFSISALIAPFRSPAPEPWTGFGVIGMYLFLVIVVTVALRRYIPYRIWRFLHWLAFPLYVLALLHGIGSGADTGSFWVQGMYLVTASTVLMLTFVRLLQRGRGAAGMRVRTSPTPFDRSGQSRRLPPRTSRRVS